MILFIFGIIFVENGSCLIGLFEFGFFASELQLQQQAAGDYSFSPFVVSYLFKWEYVIYLGV